VPTIRVEALRAHDGGEFTGHLAIPDSGYGPGMVVCQEILGITRYIREVCERLASLGYVALAPDLYWRIEPGVEIDEQRPDALQTAFGYMGRLDFAQAADDAVAALDHLRTLPETDGRAGVIGFCLGGGLAYFVAAQDAPDTCVSYYGSAVPAALDMAPNIACPILFHFGTADEYVTGDKVEAVRVAFADRADSEFHLHEGANHAFDNWNLAPLYHEGAAKAAWPLTAAFLEKTLPVQS
jgi:carboxymethylenebutenolidase